MERAVALPIAINNEPFHVRLPVIRSAMTVGLVALAYAVMGRLSLLLAIPPGYATAIFPPAGLALALVLNRGPWVWCGIWLGSFCLNEWVAADSDPFLTLVIAAVIGAGAALQAQMAAKLIKRAGPFPNSLTQPEAIFWFMFLGGPVACVVNATVGATVLYLAGLLPPANYLWHWYTWWIGDSLGVLIGAPLSLIVLGVPRADWQRKWKPVGVPLILALAIVVTLFVYSSKWETERNDRDLAETAKVLTAAIQTLVDEHLREIRAVANLIAVVPAANEAQFQTFSARAMANRPALQALEWAPCVPASKRALYEAETLNAQGRSRQIFERDQSLQAIPASARIAYYPITFVTPVTGNESALGFDLASEVQRKQALEHALAVKDVVASNPVRPVQDPSDELSIILVNPVFDQAAACPGQLVGFVVGVLRFAELVQAALPAEQRLQMDVALIEASGPERVPVYFNHRAGTRYANHVRLDADRLDIAGRPFLVNYFPSSDYLSRHRSWQAWTYFAAGLLLTGLFGGFLLALAGRNEQVEGLVKERTVALVDAEAAVVSSEERFHTLARHAPLGIFMADADGHWLYANPMCEALLGSKQNSLLGAGWLTSLSETLPPIHEQWLGKAGASEPIRIELQAAAGGFALDLRATPFFDSGARLIGYVGTLCDVSAHKQVEATLRAARDAALASVDAKSRFVANVSHELRTPLNAILGMLSVLQMSTQDGRQQEYLHLAQSAGEQLLTLIENLLDVSKFEAGKLVLEHVEFDPRALVEDVAESLAPRAAEKDILIVAHTAGCVPRKIRGDRSRLRQILFNVIGNAVKFTTAGQIVIRSYCDSSFSDRPQLCIEILDTGIGISPSGCERVFDAFTQVDESSTRRYGGTGLGLTITRHLVEAMGGTISVESIEGRGTVFRFSIVVEPLPSVAPTDIHPDWSNLTAVIATPSRQLRKAIVEILQPLNIRCIEVGTGEALLARFAAASAANEDLLMADPLWLMKLGELPHSTGCVLPPVVFALQPFGTFQSDLYKLQGVVHDLLTVPPRRERIITQLMRTGSVSDAADMTALAVLRPSEQRKLERAPVARILAVDDADTNLCVIRALLQHWGYGVDTCTDGMAALTRFEQHPYDLVFMDCHMPIIDGYETTRRIRQLAPPLGDIPVIALTAAARPEDQNRCLAAGMNAYLSKPIDVNKLLEILRDWLPGFDQRPQDQALICGSEVAGPEVTVIEDRQLTVLRDLLSPPDFSDLIHGFLTNVELHLKELMQTGPEHDRKRTIASLHQLKGSSANMGAVALASEFAKLEARARDASTATMSMQSALPVWEQTRRAFNAYLQAANS